MTIAIPAGDHQALATLRAQLIDTCFAISFLVTGLTACAIAALRRRKGVRIFLWLGIWSASYGLLHLFAITTVIAALPAWLRAASPYVRTTITYLTVVIASIAWLEMIVSTMRRIVIALLVAASVTAVLGIGWFVATGADDKFLPLNNFLAACVLGILVSTVASKRLFQKYLLLPKRGFLAFGTFVFASEALFVNLTRPLGFRSPLLLDHLGFAVLLIAFGYSALQMVFDNERRLLAIENELEIARQIQSAILPTAVPEVRNLRIAVAYQPMTAVAGDFYEFLPVDGDHAGFLVADVCGHGVPAALIASMLKVAVQSVAGSAHDPAEFLSGLNRALSGPLRGQLVSAAYLWIDMEVRKAFYSAAGHPPLLRWNHTLERIESNGLLFGVVANAEYPVHEIPLLAGDRLLLYTDGITEPENAAGYAFGESQLQQVLFQHAAEVPEVLSRNILSEIQSWQPTANQQDDMTLIVIDVV